MVSACGEVAGPPHQPRLYPIHAWREIGWNQSPAPAD